MSSSAAAARRISRSSSTTGSTTDPPRPPHRMWQQRLNSPSGSSSMTPSKGFTVYRSLGRPASRTTLLQISADVLPTPAATRDTSGPARNGKIATGWQEDRSLLPVLRRGYELAEGLAPDNHAGVGGGIDFPAQRHHEILEGLHQTDLHHSRLESFEVRFGLDKFG